MTHVKIKVGHYYQFKLNEDHNLAFAVLYGFERGKNKDVYTVRMYDRKRNFEFPLEEATFDTWAKEQRIKEITPEEALAYAL
jgi:hypothetical protein